MHGTFDRSGKTGKTGYRDAGIRLVAIPALLAIALVVLAIKQPDVSRWMAEAAQAEFASTAPAQEVAPNRVVPPAGEIRTVKAD